MNNNVEGEEARCDANVVSLTNYKLATGKKKQSYMTATLPRLKQYIIYKVVPLYKGLHDNSQFGGTKVKLHFMCIISF